MNRQEQPCALRALTLCDGQVLEDPAGALTECPHKVLSDEELAAAHPLAAAVLCEVESRLGPL